MDSFNISAKYPVSALLEISVDVNGSNYLVIYGRHINGGWCCIPNWGIGCEMSDPSDTFYNREALEHCGISKRNATGIAAAIKEAANNDTTFYSLRPDGTSGHGRIAALQKLGGLTVEDSD